MKKRSRVRLRCAVFVAALLSFCVTALAQEAVSVRLHEGTVHRGRFGLVTTPLGDVDFDGRPDYAIAAPQVGVVRVFSGRTGNVLYSLHGEQSTDDFGSALDTMGDVDGDGVRELIVGARRHDPPGVTNCLPGKAYVFSGRTGAVIHENEGLVQLGQHGSVVAGLEDVDGDGVADFLVGAPRHLSIGRITVYSGASGAPIYTRDGSSLEPGFGTLACGLGDLDGDGRGDFLMGTRSTIFVYSGALGSVLLILDESRESAASVGDVNLDGVPDFGIGGMAHNLTRNVEIYSGADFSLLATLPSPTGLAGFGRALAPAGDQNDDAIPDVAVSAPWPSATNGDSSGRVYIFDVSTGGVVADWLHSARRSGAGVSLSLLGDLNCDGRPEILAGADSYDPVESNFQIIGAAIVLSVRSEIVEFVRGDANGDQAVNLTDALVVLEALFGAQPLGCAAAADVDDNGIVQITDVIRLVSYLFTPGSSPPEPPFPACGSDGSNELLCCESQIVTCP